MSSNREISLAVRLLSEKNRSKALYLELKKAIRKKEKLKREVKRLRRLAHG